MRVLITGGGGNLGRYVIEEMKGKHEITVFDTKEPLDREIKFINGNILDLPGLENALKDIEAVVHLAAIPNPAFALPEKVFNVNVMGTFNVLEAARKCKVRRVVTASSDSTLGFFNRTDGFLDRIPLPLIPEYLPIDENHPLKTEGIYGLSKLVGEEICHMYTTRAGMETVCLRICFIWFPQGYVYEKSQGYDKIDKFSSPAEGYRGLVENPDAWWHSLWVYQDARDAAQAFRLGAEVPGLKHERLFISADDNGTRIDSLELIEKYYPGVKKVNKENLKGRASLISNEKAKRILGYKPRYSWKDLFGG